MDTGVRSTGERWDRSPGCQMVLKPQDRSIPPSQRVSMGGGGGKALRGWGIPSAGRGWGEGRRQAETDVQCTTQDTVQGPLGTLGSQVSPLCVYVAAV